MNNQMSFASVLHMLLPLLSYTSLVESAALPPLLIGDGEMIVQPLHDVYLNKKRPKGGYIVGRKEEARLDGGQIAGCQQGWSYGYAATC